MKLHAVDLRRIAMPLVRPFRTSFGVQTTREVLLVRVVTDVGEGWGECVALAAPVYSSEYVDGAHAVLRDHLVPRVLAEPDLTARGVARTLGRVVGHRMAKAAIETAVLDAELRAHDMSLGTYLGAVRTEVECGVSVGIAESVDELLAEVGEYVDHGYRRIKLKIEPGWDVEPVRAVRERFGDDLLLQVDANTAYTLGDARQLAKLDPFDLLLIEQPLPEDDVRGHAELAKRIKTPVCLDESVTSARAAADVIALGACQIINVKPGRVGGYLEARRIAAIAAANGVPVWCGGMLETGIGRGANAALAACSEFTLPGDVSASDRFYARDVTPPFVLEDGHIRVPSGPGVGPEVLPDVLDEVTVSVETIRP
jgi:O-succinylbenzoate synthase